MTEYKRLNNIFGLICFLVATSVYVMTMERTGSWWDCGEFISCDYKLQVPHQPGAPLYILIYKIFTLLAGGDRSKIAFWGNFGSAVCSGATIMFLFWTISAFAKKILIKTVADFTQTNLFLIFGASFVGALAYTFSDTFWFDAAEAEVYALASLTVAITFWAALKWEAVSEEPGADRWLLFISLMIGLSLGVHLLNLLTIPAVVFVVYFKRVKQPKPLQWMLILLLACAILGFVMDGIVPGTVKLTATIDRFFVNELHFPMGSGVVVTLAVIGLMLVAAVASTWRFKLRIWNTAALCLTFIYIGFGVFIQVPIRAHANPPLNNQHPDDPYNFLQYLTRGQYGDGAPLVKGPLFTSEATNREVVGTNYGWDGKSYVSIGSKTRDVYNPDETVLFPRIWDNDNRIGHVDFYRTWLGLSKDQKPSWLRHNLGFFFTYQVGWMFGRYFMWNFVGRQNDVQGLGDASYGNCISGISPLDAKLYGPQIDPPKAASRNLAHNCLFFLPFILGLGGMFFQLIKAPKDFTTLLIFFLFTGLAIIVFLNQTGPEPRERDYSFGGAFYTFSIWIGLGVLGLADWFKSLNMKVMTAVMASVFLCFFAVPVVMASQEWDDHDRSARTTVRDFASDYLNSCDKNAILFTYGDNDTYPLWYAQEVEGIRPDVRVVNLSLLGIDWYVKQAHEAVNESPAIAFSMPSSAYFGENRNVVPFNDLKLPGSTELKDIMDLIGSDDPAAKVQYDNQSYNYFPTKNVKMTVNPQLVLSSGTVAPSQKNKIVPELTWTLPSNNLFKNDVAELDIIFSNAWQRPIYFAKSLPQSAFLGLKDYLHLEGLTYRLLPIKAEKPADEMSQGAQSVNLEPMYNNFMNRFKWGNINKDIFLDPESRSMVPELAATGWNLAYALYKVNKADSAIRVLDYMSKQMPSKLPEFDDRTTTRHLNFNIMIAGLYYDLKQKDKAHKWMQYNADYITQYLNYFSLKGFSAQDENVQALLYMLQLAGRMTKEKGDEGLAKSLEANLSNYSRKFGVGAGPER